MTSVNTATRVWTRQQAREGRRAARQAMLFGLGTTLAAIGQAGCVAILLGTALAGHVPGPRPLAGFLLLAGLRAGLGWLADRAALRSGAMGRHRLRADALRRMLAAGPALLRQQHSAELAATLVDRIEALDGFFARWIPAAFLALAGPALVLAAALLADPVAGLILLGAGLLVPVGQAVSGIGAAAASRRQFRAMARLQARFLDRVRGIATIVLAGRAEDEARALGEAADELRRRTLRVLRVAFLASVVLDLAAAAALIGLVLRYRGMFGAHSGDPARALFALLLVPEFFAPLRAFAAAYQDRFQAAGAAEALLALPALPEPVALATPRQIEARGLSVAFDGVRFAWDAARGPALDGLSFFVPPGETLVLAGPSGSGKSTVIELLLGFVRPDAGRILINGHDIADFVPETLAGLTAWIGQRPMLFAGTIRENIGFARAGATQGEIEEAARRARVTEFAAQLPDGLDQRIGEGGYGLSGGQAQRVAIARAFLRNAKLLLLDEPTASLDPATEGEVLAALKNLAAGRTVILASHSAAAHGFSGRRVDLRDGRAVTQARGAA